jgi:hypothetical protein
MGDNERTILRLLANRARLSRVEKEDILARVLDGVVPQPRRRWLGARVFGGALGGLAVVGALLLWLVPTVGHRRIGDFVARGGSSIAAVRAFCGSDPTGDSCLAGEALFFEVRGAPPSRYFAAFARRADGLVIWYFPETDAAGSLDLETHIREQALDRQVRLGDEHRPGRYDVSLVFSPSPVSREDVKRWVADPRSASGIVRAQQALVVR